MTPWRHPDDPLRDAPPVPQDVPRLDRDDPGGVRAARRGIRRGARAAAQRGVDGVVAGHIHHAEYRRIDGIDYYNDGDWVEGCTALVEHFDGRMEVLHWAEIMAERATEQAAVPA